MRGLVNYLAHLYLAGETPESLLGNLLADFVKAPLSSLPHPGFRQGVELHRRIDRFTDAHPAFLHSRSLFTPARRRAAPALVDIFYDHFLARDWERYSDMKLMEFLREASERMEEGRDAVPDFVMPMLDRILPVYWLAGYGSLHGVRMSIDRLAQRRRPGLGLSGGADELEANYEAFEADFRRVFEDLCVYVRETALPAAMIELAAVSE
ncbi:MAG: ACP phosphodiesterase [Bryobacteraceae bacterium]|nr:ACP phosphodiesterase [Bryobacteraceae bacterium]